jgi:hypothetical protein
MKLKILTLLLCFISLSFRTPEKTSNIDLRTFETVLSIGDVVGNTYELKKSTAGQYFLTSVEDKQNNIFKVSEARAKKIDETFVEGFIKLKYMMPEMPGKCIVRYSLLMRGEATKICKKEKDKINQSQKIVSLFKDTFK